MKRALLRQAAEVAKSDPKLAYTMVTALDEDALTELRLYMENESSLHNQFMSIIKNIQRKMKSGRYDPTLAPKLWMYWVDEGAKRYLKEFAGPGAKMQDVFPKPLREALAKEFAQQYEQAIQNGEYGKLASNEHDPVMARMAAQIAATDPKLAYWIMESDDRSVEALDPVVEPVEELPIARGELLPVGAQEILADTLPILKMAILRMRQGQYPRMMLSLSDCVQSISLVLQRFEGLENEALLLRKAAWKLMQSKAKVKSAIGGGTAS